LLNYNFVIDRSIYRARLTENCNIMREVKRKLSSVDFIFFMQCRKSMSVDSNRKSKLKKSLGLIVRANFDLSH
jgi:hypothetical protein